MLPKRTLTECDFQQLFTINKILVFQRKQDELATSDLNMYFCATKASRVRICATLLLQKKIVNN